MEHLQHVFAVPTLDGQFWAALLGIIWIDLILSGDNAVVIALVCSQLPPAQRRMGMILGATAAIGLRVVFAFLVGEIMGVPYLSVIAGLFLIWIACKMLSGGGEPHAKQATSLWGAVVTIAIADAGMSLDNVMAIAGLSHGTDGSVWLMAIGVLLSIPLVILGAALISAMLERFPILIWAGAGLLGWVAGGIIAADPWMRESFVVADPKMVHLTFALAGALLVILWGIGNRLRAYEPDPLGH